MDAVDSATGMIYHHPYIVAPENFQCLNDEQERQAFFFFFCATFPYY